MKKTVFLSIALSLYGTTFSQTFFLRAGGGYALPVAHDGGYSYESGPTSETVSYIRWSLGEGSSAFLSAGFFSGKNFGAELHSRYFYGKEKSYRQVIDYDMDGSYATLKTVYSFACRMWQLSPAFLIRTAPARLTPYAGAGPVFVRGYIDYSELWTDESPQPGLELNWKIYKGTGIGFSGMLGLDIKITNKFGAFLEARFTALSWSPERGTLRAATVNGTDMMDSLYAETRKREIEYVDDYTLEYYSSPPDDEPAKVIKKTYPLSGVEVGAGIKYQFRKKTTGQ